ncbi:hypothetical protein VT84_05560 [Gemmata sp. SH-PL17]|uniref:anti-sigma factor family protein n=1 Tax=Gemmata sp. SH-PL17 TaxID=1630693 RepID=UPI00078CFEE9|nr:hypothetical protein [Gemmata sp. SH-PL17]AMV23859.1 hypothetical protein VT84_05560 [Gemmata sp. SH-PL17]
MSDADLIDYLFDVLDPADRSLVAARISADPHTAARLEQLRASVAPVLATAEAEREDMPAPPPGLALRALARVAQHVVEHEPRAPEPTGSDAISAFLREFSSSPPTELEFGSGTRAKVPGAPRTPRPAPPVSDGPDPQPSRRFRADLLVAACIAFVGFGLVSSGIAKARQQQRIYACQNSLRTLHVGLAGYADSDPQGRYPQIGTPAHPTADTFAASLSDQGHLPAGFRPGCPAAADYIAYAYTLGFRTPNDEILGLRRADAMAPAGEEHDLMPIAADFPTASAAPFAGPVSPHSGCMNVLFVGGNVRPTTSALVGPGGDDIYRNLFGQVSAGASRTDAVLGRPGDRP